MATLKWIVPGRSSNAPRRPDEEWDELRPIITERFKIDSLANVMIFMQQEHNFFASKRQYVYRLGQWGCTKYRKGKAKASPAAEAVSVDNNAVHPNPGGPPCPAIPALPPRDVAGPVLASHTLAAPNSNLRQQWPLVLFAEILFAFGATACSFNINVGLGDAMACIRAAQTRAQDNVARDLARNFLGTGERPEQTWETKFWDLAMAHAWGRGSDAEHGLQQVITTTKAIITEHYDDQRGEFQDHLEFIAPREPRLDIPAFLFLRSAMEWHNRELHGEFDIPRVIDQFVRQQLAPREPGRRVAPLSINCIPSCLAWCIDMLGDPRAIRPSDPFLPHSTPAAETYLVLCTLWRLWMSQGQIHPAPAPLSWADNSEPQLGIRPTELLSTVVCMIMAAVPGVAKSPNISVREKALAGAKFLDHLNCQNLNFDDLSSDQLLRRFLHQVWVTNAPLLVQRGEGRQFHLSRGAVDVGAFRPYVAFAASVLGIPWAEAARAAAGMGEDAVVYPIVLARVE